MAGKFRVVHLNFEEYQHDKLKEAAKAVGMPLATYAKSIVLENLGFGKSPVVNEDKFVRLPRKWNK